MNFNKRSRQTLAFQKRSNFHVTYKSYREAAPVFLAEWDTPNMSVKVWELVVTSSYGDRKNNKCVAWSSEFLSFFKIAHWYTIILMKWQAYSNRAYLTVELFSNNVQIGPLFCGETRMAWSKNSMSSGECFAPLSTESSSEADTWWT